MPDFTLGPAPAGLGTTRASLHAVAEHALAAARHAATGHIALVAEPGGFGTPPLPDARVLRVEGVELVDGARRAPLTTLGAAWELVGVSGLPDGIYPIATPRDPELVLETDADAAECIETWFGLGHELLSARAADSPEGEARSPLLWPEHFDLAVDLDRGPHRAIYGFSPGDGSHAEPYVYVTPWEAQTHPFWNEHAYASLAYADVVAAEDPAGRVEAFFAEAWNVLDALDTGSASGVNPSA